MYGRAAIALDADLAVAGHREDQPGGRIDPADTPVPEVGDEQVPGGIEGHLEGVVEPGGGGRAAVALEARGPRARHRCDDAGGVHPAHPLTEVVRNV